MAENNLFNPQTVASALTVQRSSPSSELEEKAEAIIAMLTSLAPLYHKSGFNPAEAKSLFAAFVEDLIEFDVDEIRNGITEYRRDSANRFFPNPAQIRDLCSRERKHRNAMRRTGRTRSATDNRPMFWWMLRKWNEDWSERDIPAEFQNSHRLAIMRGEGPQGTYRKEP